MENGAAMFSIPVFQQLFATFFIETHGSQSLGVHCVPFQVFSATTVSRRAQRGRGCWGRSSFILSEIQVSPFLIRCQFVLLQSAD